MPTDESSGQVSLTATSTPETDTESVEELTDPAPSTEPEPLYEEPEVSPIVSDSNDLPVIDDEQSSTTEESEPASDLITQSLEILEQGTQDQQVLENITEELEEIIVTHK